MAVFLVADIGGTYARFALIEETALAAAKYSFSQPAKLPCTEFKCFEAALDTYFASVDTTAISHACIAIAAPVRDDTIQMTNLNWSFSVQTVRQRLGLKHLEILNDAAAGALASTCLGRNEIETIKSGIAKPGAVRVNIIPGTGLGVAAALPVAGKWYPIQGEGGHISLAPQNSEEIDLFSAILKADQHISAEDFLSGPGMLRLYHALVQLHGQPRLDLSPAEMTDLGVCNQDKYCSLTVELYCKLLAGLAGDYALVFGAHGGVYLSGNIMNRIGIERLRNTFTARFSNKGAMSQHVNDIPVYLMKPQNPGLIGAAVWLDTCLDASSPTQYYSMTETEKEQLSGSISKR